MGNGATDDSYNILQVIWGFYLGESESVFSRFLLDHIISKAGELFVLFAYRTIDDYWFNVFIIDLGATYYVSLVKQLG